MKRITEEEKNEIENMDLSEEDATDTKEVSETSEKHEDTF